MFESDALLYALATLITVAGTLLYLKMRQAPGRRVIGDDVFQDVWVEQADIEARRTIQVSDPADPNTPIVVHLPEEASHGTALRLDGKGDLYLRIKVRSPYRRV